MRQARRGKSDAGYSEDHENGSERFGPAFNPSSKDERSKGGDVAFAESDSDIGSLSSAYEDQELEDDSGKSDDEDKDEEEAASRWKSGVKERARDLHSTKKHFRISDLSRMLYDESLTPAEVLRKWKGDKIDRANDSLREEGEEDENFFRKAEKDNDEDFDDRTIPAYDYDALSQKWSDTSNLEIIRQRFASANLFRGKSWWSRH